MINIPSQLSKEITDKYGIQDNTFILQVRDDSKDRIETEIGDIKREDFLPQVKIKRWDNEVNFSVRLLDDGLDEPTITTEGEKIVWDKNSVKVEFYDYTENEGGQKMVLFFKEKPSTNKVRFSVNRKGLDFLKQLPLTQKEIDEGVFRSENVVNSYAIYCSENKTNWEGGKLYRVGKLGHDFAPKITDANGWSVYGDLDYVWEDDEHGERILTIPQDFLDNAVYPIKSNENFGYEGDGQSAYNPGGQTIYTYPFTGVEGDLVSISAKHTDWSPGGGALVIYDASNRIDYTAYQSWGSAGWAYDVSLIIGATVSVSTYYLGWCTGTQGLYFDSDAGNNNFYQTVYSSPPPATWTKTQSGQTRKFSIYATVAVSALEVTTQAVSDVTGGATATGNGNITALGGDANADKRGFVYDTTSRGDPGNTAPGDSDYSDYVEDTGTYSTGAFTKTLTGLAGETYYVRAYAHGDDAEGYAYGDEVSFLNLGTTPMKALVVAGGGGGGGTIGGGGGAGGLFYNATFPVQTKDYAITIGDGGLGAFGYNSGAQTGVQGSDSVFDTATAIGGGGGAGWTGHPSTTGGSGGGGSSGGAGSAGTVDQGNAGGNYQLDHGGGGGGAGGVGDSGTDPLDSVGGVGLQYDINGTLIYYAGGGGGGVRDTTGDEGGAGGDGGGGDGEDTSTKSPTADGTANTGGGGGGAGYNGVNPTVRIGGNGGSGIVIISWVTADYGICTVTGIGNAITIDGSNSIATFIVDGNFTVVAGGGGEEFTKSFSDSLVVSELFDRQTVSKISFSDLLLFSELFSNSSMFLKIL